MQRNAVINPIKEDNSLNIQVIRIDRGDAHGGLAGAGIGVSELSPSHRGPAGAGLGANDVSPSRRGHVGAGLGASNVSPSRRGRGGSKEGKRNKRSLERNEINDQLMSNFETDEDQLI